MDEINNFIIVIFRRGDYLNIKLNQQNNKIQSYEKAIHKLVKNQAFESIFIYKNTIMVAKTDKVI